MLTSHPRQGRSMLLLVLALSILTATSCLYEPDPANQQGSVTEPPVTPPPPSSNRPPVSSIVLAQTAKVDTDVLVQNVAHDPDGDAITAYMFESPFQKLTKTTYSATLRFPSPGNHTVTVTAKDVHGAWSAPVSRTIVVTQDQEPQYLFVDDGTLEPIDLGYEVGYPISGATQIISSQGIRSLILNAGRGTFQYFHPAINVAPGAHFRFGARLTVTTTDFWLTAADDLAYAAIELHFLKDGRDTGATFFWLARVTLLSEGQPGAPVPFENLITPGKHGYERVQNDVYVTRDIELDSFFASHFSPAKLTIPDFNQVSWLVKVFDIKGRGEEYYRKADLDYLEVYLP